MENLALKLILTPALIGAVSLAGRRWGPGVSGWLVGLPLTSGPVALFLALDHGTAFAAGAARGILAGVVALITFTLSYAWLAFALDWRLALAASWGVFFTTTAVMHQLSVPVLPMYLVACSLLLILLRLLPRKMSAGAPAIPPAWDLPLRMVVATAFVLLLTGLAPRLGPQVSGLLAPFPIFASVLGAFTHRLQGAPAAARLFRGLTLGMFAFASFFLVVGLLIERAGVAVTFLAASVVAVAVQGGTLLLVRGRG
ncbi:MAG TPA: hypothetical protein VID73_02565 [Ktedonobacterales bacterium]